MTILRSDSFGNWDPFSSTALNRRDLIARTSAAFAVLAPGRAISTVGVLSPEQFGARGDGRTNDTEAFARMAAFVNAQGGGEIVLQSTTYVVGRQSRAMEDGQQYAFEPAPVMDFHGCRAPLIIRGAGARLTCAAGLRYGTFERDSGRATHHSMPNYNSRDLASPYHALIRVEECSAGIEISDLELDGNLTKLQIGGQFGDVGWQIPSFGIHLANNSGPEHLSRIHTHHHALDGILIDGLDRRSATSTLWAVRSEYNGRQGCSITGGSGYSFTDCSFDNTGKAGLWSPPGAGVDIEAENNKRVRDLRFLRCRFSNNSGAGITAESGDSEEAIFEECKFVGTTNWAAWPNKPRFRFLRSTFVGPIVHAFGNLDPQRACQFHDCRFFDDPALSPNGLVYGGPNPSRPIADLPDNLNTLFQDCTFKLTGRAVLPWTTNVTIFSNCIMSQRSPARSYPRGTFIGRNVITGNVDLYSARVEGDLIVNGRRVS